MSIRSMYKAVQWLIIASAVFSWGELVWTGWENLTFQRSFCSATALLFLFAIQSFLKWKIAEEAQRKENGLYQESLIRELDNLKDDLHWEGNARLEVALQKMTLGLNPSLDSQDQ